MSLYDNSKPALGAVYPINAVATQWQYLEPLIDPEKLKTSFLLGLPLQFRDPLTGVTTRINDEILKEYIARAVSVVETELQTQITPIQVDEKHAFDKRLYESYGYFRTHYRPVSSIEKLTIRLSNGDNIFEVPAEWIDVGYLQIGQINIIPLVPAYTNSVNNNTTPGGAVFFNMMTNSYWISSFWCITYTAGFVDMKIPVIFNELIGCVAAMDVLSQLGAMLARTTSSSLSVDGLSQSMSGPGPQLYALRIQQLEDKKQKLIKKLKKMFRTIDSTNF